jgi:hypothetical protein
MRPSLSGAAAVKNAWEMYQNIPKANLWIVPAVGMWPRLFHPIVTIFYDEPWNFCEAIGKSNNGKNAQYAALQKAAQFCLCW